jgi:S1-C subfamily serine protease
MKYLLIVGFVVTVGMNASAQGNVAAQKIAKGIAVEIRNQLNDGVGSGFIVHKKGDLYTVVTNRHVVCVERKPQCASPPIQVIYTLTTADGQKHQVPVTGVKMLGTDLDLAIIQFRSTKSYTVAEVERSKNFRANDPVYLGGFPYSQPGFRFSTGQALATVKKRLPGDGGGYTIIYDALTMPGMSGSGVLNQAGKVVAIHGQGDRYRRGTDTATTNFDGQEGVKIGTNRGIPVLHLVQELQKLGISLGSSLDPSPGLVNYAEEYLIQGYNRWINSNSNDDKRAAIQMYSKAIELDPKQAKAYLLRGYTYLQLGEISRVLVDYDAAVQADSQYAFAYFLRGVFKTTRLNDHAGALADYNRAITLKPTLISA